MRKIIYDEITVTILADKKLKPKQRKELLRVLQTFRSRIEGLVRNELIPENIREHTEVIAT